jgi:hypothetical protein
LAQRLRQEALNEKVIPLIRPWKICAIAANVAQNENLAKLTAAITRSQSSSDKALLKIC